MPEFMQGVTFGDWGLPETVGDWEFSGTASGDFRDWET